MSGHTPGPWVHYDDSRDGKTNRHEICAIGKTVCHIYHSVPAEDFANARLIAAAPELLNALKKIAAYRPLTFAECSDAEAIIGIAEDAIAKATNQQGNNHD